MTLVVQEARNPGALRDTAGFTARSGLRPGDEHGGVCWNGGRPVQERKASGLTVEEGARQKQRTRWEVLAAIQLRDKSGRAMEVIRRHILHKVS